MRTGDGNGGHLEIVDVHPRRVAADDDGTLEHPGCPAGVTRGGDRGPLSKLLAQAMDSAWPARG